MAESGVRIGVLRGRENSFPDAFIAVSDPCKQNLHYVDQKRMVKIMYSYGCRYRSRRCAGQRFA